MRDAGIYVHIPFCQKKCLYCDFFSRPADGETIDAYVAELVREIKKNAGAHINKRIRTIYFGGGTPSLLTPSQMRDILEAVYAYFKTEPTEITVEINPNSSGYLKEYADLGVNRASVGVQSTDDAVLRKLGRLHTAEEALDCLDRAGAFFDSVSADLILGVDEKQKIGAQLALILPLVDHLSAYILKVEQKTPLRALLRDKKITIATEEAVVDQYRALYAIATAEGFYRYEISNFARLGRESRHNSAYWRLGEYLGFGAGAHSYADGKRYCNAADLDAYLKGRHSGNGHQIVERGCSLSEDKTEYVMLSLRTAAGVDVEEYNRRFGGDFFAEYADKLKKMDEYLIVKKDRVGIRPQYTLVQNSIIFELL